MAWVRDVTRDAVRHFAWGVGDNNPLWLDPEHAQRSRWGGILAPPCFLYALHETTVAPDLDDRQRVYAAVEWEWFDAVRLGSQLLASAGLTDTKANAGGAMQTGTVEFLDGGGALVARACALCLRPTDRRDPTSQRADRRYTDTELTTIEQAILSESRRGGKARFWEDVAPGDRLETLTKGPLSIMDIVAWCAGALGVPERSEPVSAGGLLDETVTGPQLTAWFAHLITDWAGDDAFLHRLNVSITEQPGLGSTTFLDGEVTHCSLHDGRCAAQLYLTATNPDDERLATATAVVVLPSTEHGPVALPIPVAIAIANANVTEEGR